MQRLPHGDATYALDFTPLSCELSVNFVSDRQRPMIDDHFGTWRGAVRLGLSYLEVATGRAAIKMPETDVRRLVFICHGNICRSAFADVVARQAGLNTASFGLSTSAGLPAHPPAADAALQMGYDLSAHRTTRAEDFIPAAGDLLLAMEVRQLWRLSRDGKFSDLPRALLGLWAQPSTPHLHDPYELRSAYMLTCLKRIETAIPPLLKAFPAART